MPNLKLPGRVLLTAVLTASTMLGGSPAALADAMATLRLAQAEPVDAPGEAPRKPKREGRPEGAGGPGRGEERRPAAEEAPGEAPGRRGNARPESAGEEPRPPKPNRPRPEAEEREAPRKPQRAAEPAEAPPPERPSRRQDSEPEAPAPARSKPRAAETEEAAPKKPKPAAEPEAPKRAAPAKEPAREPTAGESEREPKATKPEKPETPKAAEPAPSQPKRSAAPEVSPQKAEPESTSSRPAGAEPRAAEPSGRAEPSAPRSPAEKTAGEPAAPVAKPPKLGDARPTEPSADVAPGAASAPAKPDAKRPETPGAPSPEPAAGAAQPAPSQGTSEARPAPPPPESLRPKPVPPQIQNAPVQPGRIDQNDAQVQTLQQTIVVQPITQERGERIDTQPRYDLPPDAKVVRRDGDRQILSLGAAAVAGAVAGAAAGYFVRSDDTERLQVNSDDRYVERLPGGRTRETIVRSNGVEVVTITDRYGDVVQRSRILPDGREIVLFYDPYADGGPRRDAYFDDPGRDLPPLRIDIPEDRYIVDIDRPDERVYYDTLVAPPVETVERIYSINEVRRSERIREKVRRIDLATINFAFGSADIAQNQVDKLQALAEAIKKIVATDPGETFLIEGHTDAVGSAEANLVLSDRRAESVAKALSEFFDIPAENLVTQGYGEQELKVNTPSANAENRRVTVRRITALVKPVATSAR